MNFKEARIIYMGTPEMSAKVLQVLLEEGFNVVALIAQEDQPIGRKNIITEVPTKVIAKKWNIPVFQPHKIRLDYEFVKELQPDLILTMAYGQIIPQGLIDIPKYGCINLHGSILPKYRGAAPIQRAIINGEIETGVTLMEMVSKMDAGKMYGISKCKIDANDNYTSLCEKIVKCAIDVSLKYIPLYLENKLPGEEQDENLVTFADKITPELEKLDINLDRAQFINFVRGLSENPGGYVTLNETKFKILKAKPVDLSFEGPIGKLQITKNTYLKLKDGVIELSEVQLAGKKKMDGKSFANGNKHFDACVVE